MKRIALILLLLASYAHNALAAPQGEYKAFAYTQALGCLGLTTEYGYIPDCYDYNQSGARYEWSPTLKIYVPAPDPVLPVAKLPTCSDPTVKNAYAVASDSTLTCVAGNALTGGGINVCPVFCDGTSWQIIGLIGGGGGGGGVVSVSGTPPIVITGTVTSPNVTLTTPLSAQYGGTGLTSPTAHRVPITEGSSAFALLTGTSNLPLIGQGAGSDPAFAALNLAGVGVTGVLPVGNGGTGCPSPVTVATLPSAAQGDVCTITDSTNTCIDGSAITGGGSNVCVVFYNGSAWQMVGTVSGSAGLINPMTTLGDMIYENATPAPARLAGQITTTQKFLSQTGTGSISAAPAWSIINGTGAIACTALPALTGDTSTSAGSCATTVTAVQNNSLIPNRVTTLGATLSVNLTASLNQFIILHDSITLSFSGAPSDGNIVRFKLTQNNGGSHTVTWPMDVEWPSANAPTLTTTDGQADFIQCLYDGTTTNYDCASVLNFTP